jgi:alpha-N-arabinofuranosidase
MACGAPMFWDKSWDDMLIARASNEVQCVTDHPLIGGNVSPTNDPLDVYRDFMAVPEILETKWSALRDEMRRGGIQDPHLAITELQLFAHIGPSANATGPVRLTPENLPSQATITEAIYDILIYHAAIRLSPFVELITHSAIVNHGGGLRKERERVYANPCYYAQAEFARFAGARPTPVEITSALLTAPRVLGDLQEHVPQATYSSVDAVAAIATNGDLLVSLVNRDVKPIQTVLELDGFNANYSANSVTLRGANPSAANKLNEPQAVTPQTSTVTVHDEKIGLTLAPFSIVQLDVPPKR